MGSCHNIRFTYSDVVIMNGTNLEELVGEFIEVIRQHLVEKKKN